MAARRTKNFFDRFLEKWTVTEEDVSSFNMDEYRREFRKKGFAGVKEKLSKELDWTTVKLNTAVVGNSGTGKSSFINAIRGLTAKDPEAAEVGVNETTTTCVPYKHPDNKSFIVWDMPGVGTPKFPKDKYLDAVGYDKYDFFIIISRGRFTENDLWLALEIQKRNKKFLFLRSNIDRDIEDDKEDSPDNHDEKKLLQTIRKKTENELKKNGVTEPKVFLINNRKRDILDFGKLNNELLSSCDRLKKNAMALSLAAITKEVIAEKKRVLRDRIPKIALDVASSSSEYEQKGRFRDEIEFYQKQFNIDDETIASNKAIWKLSEEDVKKFQIAFDKYGSSGQMLVIDPVAMRKEAGIWQRFADFFNLAPKNKLLFGYCKLGLEHNLDVLYEKACNLYDIQRAKQLVHSAKL